MGIEISVDWMSVLADLQTFGSQDPTVIAWQLFLKGGWVIFLISVIYVFYLTWLDMRQGQFAGKWKHVLLAIDIPRNNEQTPKAVESVFSALAGAQSNGNLIDLYWTGKVQESFSFEIVSLEGYVQFLVRTPGHFRDLIEAAVYAQYPEAEITEVNDYVTDYANLTFPNKDYKLWGTEFVLVKDYPYPIKTYPEFEHTLSGNFLDPMAGLLEIMSRFGPGEQVWLQFVVTPQKAPGWDEKAKKVTKVFKGEAYTPPETWTDKYISKPIGWLVWPIAFLGDQFFGLGGSGEKKKEEDQWKMFRITPGERLLFEKIEKKLAKLCFNTKFRFIYLGKAETFNKVKGVAGIISAVQQYNTTDSNGFKPGGKTKTGADYFNVVKRTAKRQNAILRHYAKRSNYYGESPSAMKLSQEELASLWHFPVMTVKAPTVEMAGSRRAVPPSRLPYQIGGGHSIGLTPAATIVESAEGSSAVKAPAPVGIPVVDNQPVKPVNEPTESAGPTPPPNLPTI